MAKVCYSCGKARLRQCAQPLAEGAPARRDLVQKVRIQEGSAAARVGLHLMPQGIQGQEGLHRSAFLRVGPASFKVLERGGRVVLRRAFPELHHRVSHLDRRDRGLEALGPHLRAGAFYACSIDSVVMTPKITGTLSSATFEMPPAAPPAT